MHEGSANPDRDAQFAHLNAAAAAALAAGEPVISVDTKKKELVGDFKNAGRTWRPTKTPPRVRVHDFVILVEAAARGARLDSLLHGREQLDQDGEVQRFAINQHTVHIEDDGLEATHRG